MKRTNERRLWGLLTLGGVLEVGWAVALGYSKGLTEPLCILAIVVFMGMSMYLLGIAIDGGLPSGTAYAVWVGIGAVGTMIVSILLGNEVANIAKVLCVAAIVGGVLGLQVAGNGATVAD